MKSYIKTMIKQGATEQQIFTYIMKIGDRLPMGILDPTTRKLQQKITILIPALFGIPQFQKTVRVTSSKIIFKALNY